MPQATSLSHISWRSRELSIIVLFGRTLRGPLTIPLLQVHVRLWHNFASVPSVGVCGGRHNSPRDAAIHGCGLRRSVNRLAARRSASDKPSDDVEENRRQEDPEYSNA